VQQNQVAGVVGVPGVMRSGRPDCFQSCLLGGSAIVSEQFLTSNGAALYTELVGLPIAIRDCKNGSLARRRPAGHQGDKHTRQGAAAGALESRPGSTRDRLG
jgi:hypothetical protein